MIDRLAENVAYIGHTKNGEPRPIFCCRTSSPRSPPWHGERVFRFHKGSGLAYTLSIGGARHQRHP